MDELQNIDLTQLKGKMFRHFKGDLYLLIDVAEHTETGEEMVIYKALYGFCRIYARPKIMFLSPVDKEKHPDAIQRYRFEPVMIKSVQNE